MRQRQPAVGATACHGLTRSFRLRHPLRPGAVVHVSPYAVTLRWTDPEDGPRALDIHRHVDFTRYDDAADLAWEIFGWLAPLEPLIASGGDHVTCAVGTPDEMIEALTAAHTLATSLAGRSPGLDLSTIVADDELPDIALRRDRSAHPVFALFECAATQIVLTHRPSGLSFRRNGACMVWSFHLEPHQEPPSAHERARSLRALHAWATRHPAWTQDTAGWAVANTDVLALIAGAG